MSEAENFLSRWARLKRQGVQAVEAGQRVDAAEQSEAPDATTAEAAPQQSRAEASATVAPAAEPACDISKLPPIELITASTDIRAFLAPGVPPDLVRAALRRAWVADPAIRDFVGIAENQWDFNDPNAMPGFGPLGPLDDVRRLVAQVIGDPLDRLDDRAATAEKSAALAAPNSDFRTAEVPESPATEADLLRQGDAQLPSTPAQSESAAEPSAAQQLNAREQSTASVEVPPRRQHGGALPE